jgi:hypothetical protein
VIGRPDAQTVGVTDIVTDAVHDVRGLVGVGQDNGILFFLEFVYLLRDWRDELAITPTPAKLVKLAIEAFCFFIYVCTHPGHLINVECSL